MFKPASEHVLIALFLIGLLDRAICLHLFGFRFVGDDDGILWSAALDLGHGRFHWPYFYGQDYGPMLEALVAAPFTWTGMPVRYLLPGCTSFLAMAPFWSFALWHNRHGRAFQAAVFLSMPLLLPVEYSLMTTITRGLVTGTGLLALLPWTLDVRRPVLKDILIGLVLGTAAFANPNTILFTGGFLIHLLLERGAGLPLTLTRILIGALPAALAHWAAQSYCAAHADHVVHSIHCWPISPTWPTVLHGVEMLPKHLAWLFPVATNYGELLLPGFVLLGAVALRQRMIPLGVALLSIPLLIIASFIATKVDDGSMSVFYPYSRMYLALPLLFTWGVAGLFGSRIPGRTAAAALLLFGLSNVAYKAEHLTRTVERHKGRMPPFVFLEPMSLLERDARYIQAQARKHGCSWLITLDHPARIPPQFRCYLYPALVDGSLGTRAYPRDRRHWQEDATSDRVIPDLLIGGGDTAMWHRVAREDVRITLLSDTPFHALAVIHGNDLTTDSLVGRLMSVAPGHGAGIP